MGEFSAISSRDNPKKPAGHVSNHSLFFLPVQPKLAIGSPNDIYEREADMMAEQVLQKKEIHRADRPFFKPAISAINRKCAACDNEDKELQRKEKNEECSNSQEEELQSYVSDLNNSGAPLPDNARNFFEPRFGYDFSNVKIHSDTIAAKSAESINALAYTTGSHIVFNQNQYSPETDSGKKLLAHELTHVMQQQPSVNRKLIQRQGGAPAAPVYGASCSGGATDPCQYARCTGRHDGIVADLLRASNYVISALEALNKPVLSGSTIRALDWYFNDHSPATVEIIARRLRCIALCLLDTYGRDQYGCDPDYGSSAIAYVCVGATPVCEQVSTNVCLTNIYFGKSDRTRAEVMIHECAHRIGLSLGGPDFDVYDHKEHFLRLSTAEALMNADSFALFAGAVVNGVRVTTLTNVVPFGFGLSGGLALSGGSSTWYARLNYFNLEIQHPALQIFNPNLGVSMTLLGESTSPTDPKQTASTSFLLSATAGFRLTDARPGPGGAGYFSFWGGPSLAIGGTKTGIGIGAEAGVAVGYRWKWLDASVGGIYFRDPTRPEGMKDIFTIGPSISIQFSPLISSGH